MRNLIAPAALVLALAGIGVLARRLRHPQG